MKNTALLIDANVILNYLLKRDGEDFDRSSEIIMKCAEGDFARYIAFHTLSIV